MINTARRLVSAGKLLDGARDDPARGFERRTSLFARAPRLRHDERDAQVSARPGWGGPPARGRHPRARVARAAAAGPRAARARLAVVLRGFGGAIQGLVAARDDALHEFRRHAEGGRALRGVEHAEAARRA